MRNLARIVGVMLAAALVAGAGCEKKGDAGKQGGAPTGGTTPAPPPSPPASTKPAEPEVCGPEKQAQEEAAARAADATALAERKKTIAASLSGLESAFSAPLRAGKPLDRSKVEALVTAMNATLRDNKMEPIAADLLAKATDLADRVQLCRAVQANDARLCDKAGAVAKSCRGRIVLLRRLGAEMIGRKRCDHTVADTAAQIEQGRRDAKGDPLVTLCEAAVAGDAARCTGLSEVQHQAICSALATGDAAACAKLDEKQRASCATEAAMIAGASGGVAKAPPAEMPPDGKVLIDAALGKASKTACADDAARQWHELLTSL